MGGKNDSVLTFNHITWHGEDLCYKKAAFLSHRPGNHLYIPWENADTQTGWRLTYPSEKYECVCWDYCSQINNNVPNHQPEKFLQFDPLWGKTPVPLHFENLFWYKPAHVESALYP